MMTTLNEVLQQVANALKGATPLPTSPDTTKTAPAPAPGGTMLAPKGTIITEYATPEGGLGPAPAAPTYKPIDAAMPVLKSGGGTFAPLDTGQPVLLPAPAPSGAAPWWLWPVLGVGGVLTLAILFRPAARRRA